MQSNLQSPLQLALQQCIQHYGEDRVLTWLTKENRKPHFETILAKLTTLVVDINASQQGPECYRRHLYMYGNRVSERLVTSTSTTNGKPCIHDWDIIPVGELTDTCEFVVKSRQGQVKTFDLIINWDDCVKFLTTPEYKCGYDEDYDWETGWPTDIERFILFKDTHNQSAIKPGVKWSDIVRLSQ